MRDTRSSPDTAAASADAAIGPMPEWDLRDLYPAPDSPALAADLKRAAAEAKAFKQRYQGKLAGIDGAALGGAINVLRGDAGRAGPDHELCPARLMPAT